MSTATSARSRSSGREQDNTIGTFGKYGNQDSGGKDATVEKPQIPFAWPLTVAISDTHAYVADTINRRIVRVRPGYLTEAEGVRMLARPDSRLTR
jgi:hypothetical protein